MGEKDLTLKSMVRYQWENFNLRFKLPPHDQQLLQWRRKEISEKLSPISNSLYKWIVIPFIDESEGDGQSCFKIREEDDSSLKTLQKR